MTILAHLRRQRQCAKLYQLGPRPLFEFLTELALEHDMGSTIDRKLSLYSGLDVDLVRALGGDHFPPLPIRSVGQ
jgi:hypothetical protein